MLTPIVTLGFILATLFGAAFHLVVGGDARRLALFLLCGWLGFGLGHLAGVMMSISVLNIGALRVFTGALGALIALFAAHLLTSRRTRKRSSG